MSPRLQTAGVNRTSIVEKKVAKNFFLIVLYLLLLELRLLDNSSFCWRLNARTEPNKGPLIVGNIILKEITKTIQLTQYKRFALFYPGDSGSCQTCF